MKYAREHNNWNSDQWKVLSSDKSKLEISGSQQLQYARRRSGKELQEPCLHPTVEHGGGSIQVWGCISAGGVGDLVRIDGIMNAKKYRQIFIHHAIQSGRRLIGPRFTFQQDNDPKHTANKFKRYLKRKADQAGLELMEWPTKGRDLNITEAIWGPFRSKEDQITTKVTGRVVGSPSERMEQHCSKCSAETPREHSQNNSAVLKQKGGHSKY